MTVSIDWLCLHGFTGTPTDWQPVLGRVKRLDRVGGGQAFCPTLLGHGAAVGMSKIDDGSSQATIAKPDPGRRPGLCCFVPAGTRSPSGSPSPDLGLGGPGGGQGGEGTGDVEIVSDTVDLSVAAPASPAQNSFEAEVDRLAAWLASRTNEPVALAGYSLGGRLALGLLARHPERFCGAVLVGCHAGLRDAAARAERRAADEALADSLEREGIEAFVDRWQELPLFASQKRLPESLQAAQRARRLAHDPSGLAASLRRVGAGAMPNLWDRLASIEVPIALVVGELDTKFRALGETMAQSWPAASLEIVPGAGHNVVLEAPEHVARVMGQLVLGMAPVEVCR